MFIWLGNLNGRGQGHDCCRQVVEDDGALVLPVAHLQHVLRNCASSFPDSDERRNMLRLFRSAAYAATPEVRYRPLGFVPCVNIDVMMKL